MKSHLRPVSFGLPYAFQTVFLSLTIYGVFLAAAVLVTSPSIVTEISLCLIHGGGAAALLSFWRMGRWGSARYDCFGSALLLVSAAFRIHALLDAATPLCHDSCPLF